MLLVGLSQRYLATMGLTWTVLFATFVVFIISRTWRSPRKWLRTAARTFFALWTVVFVAAGLETAFVLGYSTTDAFSLSLVSKRWNERFVERNNWDCRDRRTYRGEIPEGVKRVALVGDSFAFGHGVANSKNRFGDLIEARLKQSASGKWEVYNLAEPGADTGWEVERLKTLAAKNEFKTDVVLLAYCLNDVERLVPDTYQIVGSIINDPPKNYFCNEFYLPNFLYFRLNHFRRPEVRGYFGWLKSGYQGETWKKQQAKLDELQQWCKENHAELMVVVFPFMSGFGAGYEFEPAHAAIGEYFKSRNVPTIDLLPVYREHEKETLVVNPFDSHPNERAHRIAADAIWDRFFASRFAAAAK